ncbi:MAG: hypothetical protein WAP35_07465 [Solirubrobacterales bacterium]
MSNPSATGTGTGVAGRLWARDESLWGGPGVPEIADRLGWLDIAERMREKTDELKAWADEVHQAGFDQTVLLGMGGSSLGPEVLRLAFDRPLTMLDSTDPAAVAAVAENVDMARTMFVVSSKSGGTIETLSHFKHFYELTGGNGRQFTVVTDPGSPLEQLAQDKGLNKIWLADPEIGGRYSVLSYFGLVPAALARIPVDSLLDSAIAEMSACADPDEENTGLALGLELGKLALDGRDKLTFAISGPLGSFGLWAEQLIAESTGKHGKGILPVAGEPIGLPEVYGDDRVFIHIRADETHDNAMIRLEEAGHPVIEIDGYEGPDELGALFFLFEFATAIAGHVLEINPFDQPNVQEAKDATAEVLASGEFDAPSGTAEDIAALIAAVSPPGYVAIHGYLQPNDEFDSAVTELREVIRARTSAATTFGYGPRFLHSTGQLHKGGPATGHFIQLVHDADGDVLIPDADFTFGQLIRAQAIGDLRALAAHDRPAVRFTLEGDPVQALRTLTKQLEG